MQVLTGPEAAVEDLYGRIQRDPQHAQVELVSRSPGPDRFAAWSRDFGPVTPCHLEEALMAIQVKATAPPVSDPGLQALLQSFR